MTQCIWPRTRGCCMRCVDVVRTFRSARHGRPEAPRSSRLLLVLLALLLASNSPRTESPTPVHLQRYCMGTMFDIVAYHASRPDAARAVERAMEEIFRLDRVMSDYQVDSELSKLNRERPREFVRVEPSFFEVIQ